MNQLLDDVRREILRDGMVAAFRGVGAERAGEVAGTLLDAGVRLLEIPLTGAQALATLAELRSALGERAVVGAGGVHTAEAVQAAGAAGAQFLSSAGLFADVAGAARAAGIPLLPGACTPTEIGAALREGFDVVRLFPAGVMGHEYLKTVLGVFPGARILADGGLDWAGLSAMIDAGAAGVVLGGTALALPAHDLVTLVDRVRTRLEVVRGPAGAQEAG